jgi:hypothetical protein
MAQQADIDRVRSNIGDTAKEQVEQFEGDGSTVLYQLQYKNIFGVTVKVNNADVTPDMVYAGAGQFVLPTAPADGDKVLVDYSYAGFTDAVLGSLVDEAGDAEGATVLALQDLLASAARRSDYSQGQTKVNASQVFSHLKDLLTMWQPGGQLSSRGGLSVGSRHHQPMQPTTPPRDLSRDDNISDNNVG